MLLFHGIQSGMAPKLTRLERETIITWNEAEETANVYSTSPAVIRRMTKRCGKPTKQSGAYGAEWDIPRKWLTLPRVKKPRNLSGTASNLRGFRANPTVAP